MSGENSTNQKTETDDKNTEDSFDSLIESAIDDVNASMEEEFGGSDTEEIEAKEEEAKEEETEDKDAEEEESAEEDEETEESDDEEADDEQAEETTQRKPSRAEKRIKGLIDKNTNTEQQLVLANQMLKQQQQLNDDTARRFQEMEAKFADKTKSETPPDHTIVDGIAIPNDVIEQFDNLDDPQTIKALVAVYKSIAPKQTPIGESQVSEIVKVSMETERRNNVFNQQSRENEDRAYKDYGYMFQDAEKNNGEFLFKPEYLSKAQAYVAEFNVYGRDNTGQVIVTGNSLMAKSNRAPLICRYISSDKVAIEAQDKAKKRLVKAKKQKVTPTRSGGNAKSKSSKEDQSSDDMITEGWGDIK